MTSNHCKSGVCLPAKSAAVIIEIALTMLVFPPSDPVTPYTVTREYISADYVGSDINDEPNAEVCHRCYEREKWPIKGCRLS